MKKGLSIAAGLLSLCALCADEDDSDWSTYMDGGASVKFQTEHSYRGRQIGKNAVVPDVWLAYKANEDIFQMYVGADGLFSTKKEFGNANPRNDWRYYNKVAPYAGLKYKADDKAVFDFGYRHAFHTHSLSNKMKKRYDSKYGKKSHRRDTNEIYFGWICSEKTPWQLRDNIVLDPSVYLTYGFDNKEINLEGRVAGKFDFSKEVASGFGVEVGAKLGFDHAKKVWKVDIAKNNFGKKAYFYYGANADLVYSFYEDKMKAKVGVGYDGNSAKKKSWVNGFGDTHRNVISVSAGLECSF